MRRRAFVSLVVLALAGQILGERINHAGRILGQQQTVSAPTLFNTSLADTIVSSLQIMPRDNPWNEDISHRPLLSNSGAMIAKIKSELASNRQTLQPFFEMNYVLVPDNQTLVPIPFFEYPDESDPGPYPIPDNMPIEGWPIGYGLNGQTLYEWQHDIYGLGGDRHGVIVRPSDGSLFETWQMKRLQDESWEAANGALFNIYSNALRPFGWTSGDAAGLQMFPALVRYDECERGEVEHAVRLVVKHTRLGPIYPATHNASNPPTNDLNVPAMGQRLRLKASFTVPSSWTKEEKAVCKALKKYGGMIADNGNYFSFSVCPDDRYPEGCFDHITTLDVNQFEVIQTTGQNEGPRSPNPPTADAGVDRMATVNTPILLNGVIGGGTGNVAVSWYLYSGPAPVNFSNPSSFMTNATFTTPGNYTLMLKADDGVHTPGFDAVVVVVNNEILLGGATFIDGSVVGGGPKPNAKITLTKAAPSGGSAVALKSNSASMVVPASVTVPEGATELVFPVTTHGVAAVKSVVLTASQGDLQKTASLVIWPAALADFTVTPNPVVGGMDLVGTVTFNGETPPAGAVVSVSDNSSVIDSPASVSVSGGRTSGEFLLKTHPVGSQAVRSVTVSYGDVTKSVNVTLVTGPALAGFAFIPNQVVGGNSVQGRVSLTQPAPAGGLVVQLTSSSSVIHVPASVTVEQGATLGFFMAETLPVSSSVTRTATATLGSVTKGAALVLTPVSLSGLSVEPSTLKGGGSATGRVTLDGPAPTGGIVVSLSSSSTAITVPASVTVPAGQRSATFSVKTAKVSSTYTRSVSASYRGVGKTAWVTLTP